MKAAFLPRRGGGDELVYGDVAKPTPAANEVLVRVFAASVMPSEITWDYTWATVDGLPRSFPIIMGHEFSGVIAALGADVTGFAVGDQVYGMNDWDRQGAQAEYCLARPEQIAAKPGVVSHVQAASAPISALTAWQALVDHGQLAAGQRVLIYGGSGGVGACAVQFAHTLGAYVLTTASTANVALAQSFGADQVIDYTTTNVETAADNIDLALDTVGGATQERAWATLKPGGLLVSVVNPTSEQLAAEHRARGLFFIVKADQQQLGQIARQIDSGKLDLLVAGEYPLAQAREAFAFAEQGHRRGKTMLRVAE